MAILARFLKADATEAVAMKTAWIPKLCLELDGQTKFCPTHYLRCPAKPSQAKPKARRKSARPIACAAWQAGQDAKAMVRFSRSSPLLYISIKMSEPPMNSPFT